MVNKLSDYQVKKIISFFCEDVDATKTSKLIGLNRKTINRYFNIFREAILFYGSQKESIDVGEYEVDESYFGAKRVRGKRGRGAAGKTPVFGLLKRGDKVYVEIVPNCSKESLLPIIQGRVLEGSTIHSDGWKGYDGLILNGYDHYRVFHSHDEFVRGKSHVNGIEGFWSFAKRRLAKFNGLTDEKFLLHLKESEFRFNHRHRPLNQLVFNLYKVYFLKMV
ncbi:MAG: IS1595 family transposase [Candidatus Caenarcaniphilales bacterium]|nr:IS1595 family transposase [Candidatus Caenarcaniphilales bacterium]